MSSERCSTPPPGDTHGSARQPPLAALRNPGCWPIATLQWQSAYRVVPTRFPAIDLFDRIVLADDFDALYALEAITNDRLRTGAGKIDLVPPDERRFGPGHGPIMAALTHLNPGGSRFSPGTFGVFYCARDARTAIAEARYHTALFLSATREAPMRQPMRLYTVTAQGSVLDLRGQRDALASTILHPDDYSCGQALGVAARHAGHAGIAYPSVRDPDGECLAAFRTTLPRQCHPAAYLEYNWNGSRIDIVFELSQVG